MSVPKQPAETTTADKKRKRITFKVDNLITGVITVLIIAALGGGIAYVVHENSKSSDTQQEHGYLPAIPDGWSKASPTPEGAMIAYKSRTLDTVEGIDDGIPAQIVVQSTKLNEQAKQQSFAQISEQYESGLAAQLTDFVLISSEPIKLRNTPGQLLRYSMTQSGIPFTVASVYAVRHGTFYVVNGQVVSSSWNERQAEVEQSITTFRP